MNLQGLAFNLYSEKPTHSAGFVHKEEVRTKEGYSVEKYRRGCGGAVNSRGRGYWKEKDHATYSEGGTTELA